MPSTAPIEGTGRQSVAPERLLRASLLQAFYSVRSERQLMEQINYNLLFRWFVGLGIDDAVWDHSTFSKNRDRLLDADVAAKFLEAVLRHPKIDAPVHDRLCGHIHMPRCLGSACRFCQPGHHCKVVLTEGRLNSRARRRRTSFSGTQNVKVGSSSIPNHPHPRPRKSPISGTIRDRQLCKAL